MKQASHLHTTQTIKQENEVGNYLGMASGLGCGWCFWSRKLSLGWHLDWDVEPAFIVGNCLYIVTTYGLGRGSCFHSRELPILLGPTSGLGCGCCVCSRMKLISWDDIWIRIWIGMWIRGLSLVQRASERASERVVAIFCFRACAFETLFFCSGSSSALRSTTFVSSSSVCRGCSQRSLLFLLYSW
jgi:hypothetical protein